jgi:hypothetical protein
MSGNTKNKLIDPTVSGGLKGRTDALSGLCQKALNINLVPATTDYAG